MLAGGKRIDGMRDLQLPLTATATGLTKATGLMSNCSQVARAPTACATSKCH